MRKHQLRMLGQVVALAMDGESEHRPGTGEGAEPPSPQPQATPPEAPEEVPMATEGEGGNDDDDVVLVGEGAPPTCQPTPVSTATSPPADSSGSSAAATAGTAIATEPIVIDDEEDKEEGSGGPMEEEEEAPGAPSAAVALSSTEPDSHIKIASVTTLGDGPAPSSVATAAPPPQPITAEPPADMNLLITGVTSLQGGAPATAVVRDGNGWGGGIKFWKTILEKTTDVINSWISQSASFPRNQKLGGVDSPSPAPSLPKPQGQSSSTSPAVQPPPRTVKVTCANCKKPLKKGQTAYQRKGSPRGALRQQKRFCWAVHQQRVVGGGTAGQQFMMRPLAMRYTLKHVSLQILWAPRQPVLQNSWKDSLESTLGHDGPLHSGDVFLGAGLWEKAERQVVEQKRWVEPLRWGFLQLAQVTWERRGLGSEGAGEGESTPPSFWFRGKDADWEIQESGEDSRRCRFMSAGGSAVIGWGGGAAVATEEGAGPSPSVIRHEVSFKTVTHKICSDTCFNVYRMANGLIMNCCEQCGDYLPSRATANHALLVDGQQKRFCCLNCIKEFKQGTIVAQVDSSESFQEFCSTGCLGAYENKQNPPKSTLKTKCTVCGKLTEV
ncbi:hypothetical protein CRUP_026980 [Coryphaenoides rupestris]|nr:hypothetical protein CRUP_026980 [Coryphaenoides rupestris]